MRFCHECGTSLDQPGRFCPSCGASLTASEPAAATEVLVAGHGQTVVERVLGGDWRPALWVSLPTLAITLGLAAVGGMSTFLVSQMSSMGPFLEFGPRGKAAWFHELSQQVAMAFGSPLFISSDGERISFLHIPLLITVAAVLVFASLLRRACAGVPGAGRAVLAVRATLLAVALIVVSSLFGSAQSGSGDDLTRYSVSPWRVLGWSLLVLGLAAVIVAVRPLRLLSTHVPQVGYDQWAPAWLGAKVATAVAVGLGFLLAVVAGFVEQNRNGESLVAVAKMLPRAFTHAVDLGVNGWQIGMFGEISATQGKSDVALSLFDRHGLSPLYFFAILIPIISVLAGALAIRRSCEGLDRRTFSRNCYRMVLPMLGLYLILAVASRQQVKVPGVIEGHIGPAFWLGLLLVLAWYLLLGFGAGQLLMRGLPERQGAHREVAPEPRISRLVSPVLVAAVGALLVVGSSLAAVLNDGGRKADRADGLPSPYFDEYESDSDTEVSSSDSRSDSSSDAAEVRSALRELASHMVAYYVENDRYASSSTEVGYSEPYDILFHYESVTDSGFCITANKAGSGDTYSYDSDSGLSDGDNC